MKFTRFTINFLVAIVLSGLGLGIASLSDFGYRVETVISDNWFPLRYQLRGAEPIDPSLLIVGLDEHAIQAIGKPSLLWQKDLAELINTIKSGNPASVGLDIIIRPEVQNLESSDPLRARLEDEALQLGLSGLEPPPVIFIEQYSGGFISGDSEDTEEVLAPMEILVDLLTDENGDNNNLGFANVAGDFDGMVRRGKLLTRVKNADNQERPQNLSFRLLEEATGELTTFHRAADGSPQLSWRGVSIPFLPRESFILNYPGPTEDNTREPHDHEQSITFPIVSAKKVMEGDISPSFFQDKIVLIAPTASSLGDEKSVPGDAQYHGGATHLTVMNMFLTDSFISRPGWLWVLLSLGFGLAGFAVGRKGSIAPGIGLAALVPFTAFAAFCFAHLWLPTLFPLVSLVVGGMLGYVERLLTVERDRAKVRSTFARMVSPQVMDHVLTNYKSLKNGVRKEVTVLFSDINDFTPICEQHTPEEVIEMLSEYFSMMVDVIMKYDGYLKQYVGDEIMVIFGAPDDSDDHATRAVLTALGMRDALAKAKETSNGKPGFYEVKIGVNTGSVVVGKVGPESRWEYAAVGDNVNLGARVMSVAKSLGKDIGISAASRERFDKEQEQGTSFGDKVKWNSLGVQSFKGKISQMEVFEIERDD